MCESPCLLSSTASEGATEIPPLQDGQLRFFRSMLLYKLATDSADADAPPPADLSAIGADAAQAAFMDAATRMGIGPDGSEIEDEDEPETGSAGKKEDKDSLDVDDATLARAFTLFQVRCHVIKCSCAL
jgi:hypothetical protein